MHQLKHNWYATKQEQRLRI